MVYIPLTPIKERETRDSIIPEVYTPLYQQPKEYVEALQTKINENIGNIGDLENPSESVVKDIWDNFYLGMKNVLHKTKNYFINTLPNIVFKDVKEGDRLPFTGKTITKEGAEATNKRYEKLRGEFRKAYNKSNKKYQEWLDKNPQIQPPKNRPEWNRPALDAIKDDPSLLVDPSYIAFKAAGSASFTLGVMGTTLAVGFITKNPVLALGAGVVVATPLTSQDLFEDLVANGATEEQAANLTQWIGPIIASVEVAGDLPLIKQLGGKIFSKALTTNIRKVVVKRTMSYIVKQGLKTIAQVEFAEVMEEVLQEAIQDATVKTVNENRVILKDASNLITETLIATLPFALVGGTSAVQQEIKVAKAQPKLEMKLEEPSVQELSIEPKPKVKEELKPPEEVITVKREIPKELESLSLIAISEMGRANIQLGKVLEEATELATYTDKSGIERIDGAKRIKLEKELLKKANKELDIAQNKFYQSLNPKIKIGDIVDYQPKRSPGEIKVFGDKKIPIEKIEITNAEFDMTKSADQMKRTGFPASFKFENLVGKNVETGETVRLYPNYIVNGEILGETIGKKSEAVLKEFIALQKAPKISKAKKEIKPEVKPEIKAEPKEITPVKGAIRDSDLKGKTEKQKIEFFKARPSEALKQRLTQKLSAKEDNLIKLELEKREKKLKPKGKPAKVAVSIEAKAREKGIVETFKDLAEFTPVVIKEQVAKIEKLMEDNIERAKAMATGEEPLDKDIKGAILVKMIEDYAMENKDGELILALANSPLVSETSIAGQTLRLIGERIPDSATAKIKEIERERKKVAKEKLKDRTAIQEKEKIKKGLKEKLKEKSKKISKSSWEALINELTC